MRVGRVHPGLGVREVRSAICQPSEDVSHLMLACGGGDERDFAVVSHVRGAVFSTG